MARPLKKGLDYFPMDTKLDLKLQLLKAKYKLEGIGFIDMLFRIIYQEGYFIKMDNDKALLFSNDFGIEENRFWEMLNFCIDKEFFDKKMYEENNILTSNGIQKRYFHGSVRRENKANYEFLLTEIKLMLTETGLMLTGSTQRKVKESKLNKIKVKSKEKTGTNSPTAKPLNFIDKLITIFETEFLKVYKITYSSNGQDKKQMGLLLKRLKDKQPGYNTEQMVNAMTDLFKRCMQVKDKYLSQVTISKINSKLNEYTNAIKNPDRSNLTAEDRNRINAEYLKGVLEGTDADLKRTAM